MKLLVVRHLKKKEAEIRNELDKLFDIANCKCTIYLCDHEKAECSGCRLGAHIFCTCNHSHKIPKIDLLWLYHQRQKVGEKSMFQMSCNDKKETRRQFNAAKRKVEEIKREMQAQKIIEDSVILENSPENSVILENSPENSASSNNSDKTQCSCRKKNILLKS